MTALELIHTHAARHHTSPGNLAQNMLTMLCERLPITVLADMVAHIIATDEEGESESTSDFLYQVGKQRFGDDWQTHIESAKARYDTGYLPN